MQVYQLIEQLEYLDPNDEVYFSYDIGDYWNTQVASTVDRVSMGVIKYSAYHNMDKLLDETKMHEDEGAWPGTRSVVVIG